MTPVLELKDLHVTLRQHRRATELVKGVSFAVGPGECLGILGESGSGKSMSMKAAMGLLDKGFSVSGTATFQGEALLEKSGEELRRLRGGRVGIVLQNPMTCFDPLYRVGDQIAESFAAHNSWSGEEIRRRSLELLEKMRIRSPEEVLEKYPHQLSGGMLQRIMIEYLRDRASLEELLLACADKLANMRSIKADYMVLGDKVWDRFHRGKEQQSWYYSSLIDVFDGLSDYEMYWEISNLYTDVFVSYYLGGELGDRIYQSSGIETYCYTEEECRWTPVSTRAWKKLEPKLKVISKKEAIALEDAWRDQYPSLMCLVRHRHDTDVIVDCAKRLLDEGKDPSWFEGMWDNMGGGIPADTLRALECAFVALYTRNRGLSR